MAAKKTPKGKAKTTVKSTLRPQPHGGALRNGGTNKGGPGRPPDAFRALCRELASRDATVAGITSILQDPSHAQFLPALKWATEHGYGKAAESITVSGDTLAPLTIRVVKE